jgi:hypothetical protein
MFHEPPASSKIYHWTLVFSVLFALLGFSYNVWRMEATETNSNIRTAGFEMLKTLSELEQIVYAAHYDKDIEKGNPRTGWVKVGLITELSLLTSEPVLREATTLKSVWSRHWQAMENQRESSDAIILAIDNVRNELKTLLSSLE